jgi:O-antigen ligase
MSVGALLGAASLALIPLGGLSVADGAPLIPLPVSAIAASLCALDLLVTVVVARRPLPHQASVVPALVVCCAMFVPFALHGSSAAQAAAYGLFVLGTIGGAAVGVAWARDWERFGPVDVGLLAFVAITVLQLGLILLRTPDLAGFHRAAVLPWGASNYIAGVLVVASYLLLSRGRATRRKVGVLAVVGLLAALSTLSRGALIAVAAGGIVYVWGRGRTTLSRFVLRAGSIILPVLAFKVMTFVTTSRSVGGYDPEQNVSARWQLYRYAWSSFQASPFSGTGWLAMRNNLEFSTPISYAHNAVLSFAQIGGAFGLVALLALAVAVVRAWRNDPVIRPGLVAALAISMTDPFFEGYFAALIVWAVLTALQHRRRPPEGPEVRPAVERPLDRRRRGAEGAAAPRAVARRAR